MFKATFPLNAFNTTFQTTRGNILNANIINAWHTVTEFTGLVPIKETEPQRID